LISLVIIKLALFTKFHSKQVEIELHLTNSQLKIHSWICSSCIIFLRKTLAPKVSFKNIRMRDWTKHFKLGTEYKSTESQQFQQTIFIYPSREGIQGLELTKIWISSGATKGSLNVIQSAWIRLCFCHLIAFLKKKLLFC
jgi:hypothetical protein